VIVRSPFSARHSHDIVAVYLFLERLTSKTLKLSDHHAFHQVLKALQQRPKYLLPLFPKRVLFFFFYTLLCVRVQPSMYATCKAKRIAIQARSRLPISIVQYLPIPESQNLSSSWYFGTGTAVYCTTLTVSIPAILMVNVGTVHWHLIPSPASDSVFFLDYPVFVLLALLLHRKSLCLKSRRARELT
jgi:hypothetical protein